MTPSHRLTIAVLGSLVAHGAVAAIWVQASTPAGTVVSAPTPSAAHRLLVSVLGARATEVAPASKRTTPTTPSTHRLHEASADGIRQAVDARSSDVAASGAPDSNTPATEDGSGRLGGELAAGDSARGDAPSGISGPTLDTTALYANLERAALRCYPERARRYGLRGETRVSFCVSSAATTERVAVATSSGSGTLDSAATDCVLPGAQPFPSEAAGHCFTVPIVFGRTVR